AAEYHRKFRLHAMLAEVFELQGQAAAAAAEWQLAEAAVNSALAMQNDAQRAKFQELPAVRRVIEHQEVKDES
ncbi:MAG: hypothetical protein KJO19_01795, partial [Woeseia sp.]|nr:hypothetical protein [Woeseia sp.]MBT8095740.1 hypothetical protein [Woeseia sp.]